MKPEWRISENYFVLQRKVNDDWINLSPDDKFCDSQTAFSLEGGKGYYNVYCFTVVNTLMDSYFRMKKYEPEFNQYQWRIKEMNLVFKLTATLEKDTSTILTTFNNE